MERDEDHMAGYGIHIGRFKKCLSINRNTELTSAVSFNPYEFRVKKRSHSIVRAYNVFTAYVN